MTDRVHCCVPECRRSFRARPDDGPGDEVMCGRCWRTADFRLRARYRELHRRSRKVFRLMRIKTIKSKPVFEVQVDRLYILFVRAHKKVWTAIKEDVAMKSALRVEGTAGELAARKVA
jgi:hypothetical protein